MQTAYDAGDKVDVTITVNPEINRNVGSDWSPSWVRFDYQYNTDGNFVNFVNPYGVNYPNGIDISAISSLFVGAPRKSLSTFNSWMYYIMLVPCVSSLLDNTLSSVTTLKIWKILAPSIAQKLLLFFLSLSLNLTDFQYHSAYFANAPIVSQTLPVTLDTAEDLSILQIDDQTFNINNEYDAGSNTPDLPTDSLVPSIPSGFP